MNAVLKEARTSPRVELQVVAVNIDLSPEAGAAQVKKEPEIGSVAWAFNFGLSCWDYSVLQRWWKW